MENWNYAEKCAYAAGFFDGEGCVRIHLQQNGSTMLQVMVANTNVTILIELQKIWGSVIRNRKPLGKQALKPMYEWRLRSGEMEEFLVDVVDRTVVKRNQIEAALKYLEYKKVNVKRKIGRYLTDEGRTTEREFGLLIKQQKRD